MSESVVYFVAAPGRVKIGYTRKPEARLQNLRNADMESLSVIGTIKGSRALERMLHEKVEAHRLRGEWFRDCVEVRDVIGSALAGEFEEPQATPIDDDEVTPVHIISDGQRSELLFQILDSAMKESERVAADVIKLSHAREKNPEHIRQIEFLADKIILPILRLYKN